MELVGGGTLRSYLVAGGVGLPSERTVSHLTRQVSLLTRSNRMHTLPLTIHETRLSCLALLSCCPSLFI